MLLRSALFESVSSLGNAQTIHFESLCGILQYAEAGTGQQAEASLSRATLVRVSVTGPKGVAADGFPSTLRNAAMFSSPASPRMAHLPYRSSVGQSAQCNPNEADGSPKSESDCNEAPIKCLPPLWRQTQQRGPRLFRPYRREGESEPTSTNVVERSIRNQGARVSSLSSISALNPPF